MSADTRRSWQPNAALAALVVIGLSVLASADRAVDPHQRERSYLAAASEFGVPANVLLAVSYLESRWDHHNGAPSTAGGYGPMHLTDGRTAKVSESAIMAAASNPRIDNVPDGGMQTVDEAARLIGDDASALRANSEQNIRGGAALLAEYQRAIAPLSEDPADWYGAVAHYSGADTISGATAFADELYTILAEGVTRTTDDGQRIRLAPSPGVLPHREQITKLGLAEDQDATASAVTECPPTLICERTPAPYIEYDNNSQYGNHDVRDRDELQNQKVDYIVIHTTEISWNTSIKAIQNARYGASWNYTVSPNGMIAQHLENKYGIAWHSDNWYVNAKSVGIEHVGYGRLGTWYPEAMYRTSAKLVANLAASYGIPLDRQHIIGHDGVPGPKAESVRGMHWDPGPYWDWAHYFELMGAPFPAASAGASSVVTINPSFGTNRPSFTGCASEPESGNPCSLQGSAAVMLHTAPRDDAPLLSDNGLHPDGEPATRDISDWGSRVETGQRYALADVQGDWTAIWFSGQQAWFYNPRSAPVASPAEGTVVTPRFGSIPIYGAAYPEPAAYEHTGIAPKEIKPLAQYQLSMGQKYVAQSPEPMGSEYFDATAFNEADHVLVTGQTKYFQIQYGARLAYVKASDVTVVHDSGTPSAA